ncbi:MAG: outer membrane beta-barrel protein [Rhodothermales bacterium]|nr:outer membrane beta-barrel protein [Rhodothermales bacterium]
MKPLIFVFCTLLFTTSISAQDEDWELEDWSLDEMISDTRGFSISLDVNGSSIDLTNTARVGPEGSGGGGGIGITYGFNQLVSLIVDLDGANVSPNVGTNYTLGHLDVGIGFNFLQPDQPFRPFVGVALTGRSATFRIRGDSDRFIETTASGPALSLIAGLRYFASPSVSIDAQIIGSGGTFNKIDVPVPGGTLTQEIDVDSTTGRVKLGLSWFVGR